MVSAVRRIGAKRLLIGLTAVALGLAVSMGTGHYVSESPESGGITPSETAMEKKPQLDVPYEPTAYEIAQEMLRTADVRKDDLVYDLGCGDGRIVIMAAKERGARGVGVDLDPARIKESVENAKQAGVTDRVSFFRQDLFKTDIGKATVVMLYLWPEVNLRLRPRLLKELRPGTRVVSHSHSMGEWKPDATSKVSNHNLYFWVIPANVSGTWAWPVPTGKGNARAVLRLNQHFQEISGSLTVDNATVPLTGTVLTGDRLRLVAEPLVEGRKVTMELEGRVQGDTIRGRMRMSTGETLRNDPWKARRHPSGKVTR
jgi:SAM-dependent methyltransferase